MQPLITPEENDILLRVNKKILEENEQNPSVEPKILICPLCNKKFSQEGLESHIATHRSTKCELCDEIFATKWQLRNHSVSHKDIGHRQLLAKDGFLDERIEIEKSFICHICNKGFTVQKHLENHIRTHTKYKCEQCDKTFRTKWQLENHSITHKDISPSAKPLRIKKQPFVCHICKLDFCSKYTLLIHLRTHKKEKV